MSSLFTLYTLNRHVKLIIILVLFIGVFVNVHMEEMMPEDGMGEMEDMVPEEGMGEMPEEGGTLITFRHLKYGSFWRISVH